MQMAELVSIITPCYNDGAYLGECMEAVQRQTYPRIEWIVVDDGSSDKCTRYALQNIKKKGFTVLHQERGGPAAARNTAISSAKGKYILPLDADDTIEPEYIQKAVQVLETQLAIRVVYCKADYMGAVSGAWELPPFSIGRFLVDNIVFVSAVFHREDWMKAGGYSTTLVHGLEDYDFFLTLLELGCGFYRLEETLFHYRIKQVSRNKQFEEDAAQVQETYDLLYKRHASIYAKHAQAYTQALREEYFRQRCDLHKLNTEKGHWKQQKSRDLLADQAAWLSEKIYAIPIVSLPWRALMRSTRKRFALQQKGDVE